jgi:hypothetical protein
VHVFPSQILRNQPQTSLASSTFQGDSTVKVAVRGGSVKTRGGSTFTQLTVTDLSPARYIPPRAPTVFSFLPAAETSPQALLSPSIDSHLLEFKIQPCIQVSVIPCEIEPK